MPFFVIKKGLVLLEWKYFPTPKILDPFFINILDKKKESRSIDHTLSKVQGLQRLDNPNLATCQ